MAESSNQSKPARKVVFDDDCTKQEGEPIGLHFPGTVKACQLRDGSVITGRCHEDSSDTELQELFDGSRTIRAIKADTTPLVKCARRFLNDNKPSEAYCDLDNFKW